MKIRNTQTGEIREIADNELSDYGIDIPQTSQVQQPTQPQAKSLEGFVGNVGQDIGQNVQGLTQLPGLLMSILSGQVNLGDVGKNVATGVYKDYKDILTNPLETGYNRPVSTLLNVLPFLGAAKKIAGLGKAGEAATALSGAGKVADTASDISRLGKVADTTGDVAQAGRLAGAGKTFSSLFQVPAKIAKRIRPDEVGSTMARYGIVGDNVDDLARQASLVTGENGILSKATRTGIKAVGEIPVDDVLSSARNVAETSGLIPNKNAVLRSVERIMASGGTGKKISNMNALNAFDKVREFESQGYDLVNSAVKADQQVGKVYLAAADSLKTALDSTKNTEAIVNALKTPETLAQLQAVSPELAKDFLKAKSIADIRALQSPFVRLQHMADLTASAANTPFAKLSQSMAQGSKLGILNQVPVLNDILSAGVEKATVPATTRLAAFQAGKGGETLAKGGNILSSILNVPNKKSILTSVGRNAQDLGAGVDQTGETGGTDISVPEVQAAEIEGAQTKPELKDVFTKMLISDLGKTGGKNAAQLKALAGYMGVDVSGKKLTGVVAKELSKNKTAMRDVSAFEKLLIKNGKVDTSQIIKSSIPGSLGARNYRALWGSIIDTIGSNRTGASYTKDQRGDYAYMLPAPGDSEQDVKDKIARIKQEFAEYVGNYTSTSASEDAAALLNQ